MANSIYDVLVIGGGPAGITICKRLGGKFKTGMIRPEDHSMIYCAMPYAVEGIMPVSKTLKKDGLVTEAGADLIRDKAVNVDFKNKTVFLEKGGSVQYKKLIIATGANPVLPQVPGADLQGVFTFKTENDLENLMKAVEGNLQKAVVVGAGAIGIELAQALQDRGIETHLVDMEDSVLPAMLDPDMSNDLEGVLADSGIKVHLSQKVAALKGSSIVESVQLSNGESIELLNEKGMPHKGVVIFAVGMKPALDVIEGTDLECGPDGVMVNEFMETNIADVYAAGDCVQYISGITGKVVPGKLATNAVPMAKIITDNILGKKRRYKGFYNGAATRIKKYYAGSTGLTEKTAAQKEKYLTGYAEMTTMFPIMPETGKVRLKLIASSETFEILGGQVVSEMPVTDKVDIMTLAIQQGMTVYDLRDLSYSAQPYQSFFPANNLMVAAAEDILKK